MNDNDNDNDKQQIDKELTLKQDKNLQVIVLDTDEDGDRQQSFVLAYGGHNILVNSPQEFDASRGIQPEDISFAIALTEDLDGLEQGLPSVSKVMVRATPTIQRRIEDRYNDLTRFEFYPIVYGQVFEVLGLPITIETNGDLLTVGDALVYDSEGNFTFQADENTKQSKTIAEIAVEPLRIARKYIQQQ